MTVAVYAFLLVLGVSLLVVTAVRVSLGGIAPSSAAPIRPQEAHRFARRILAERYAAGELSTEEYQRRLRVMEEDA